MRAQVRQGAIAVFGVIAIILVFTVHGRVLALGLVIAAVAAIAVFVAGRSREPRMNRYERRSQRGEP